MSPRVGRRESIPPLRCRASSPSVFRRSLEARRLDVEAHPLDVSDDESVRALADHIERELGGADLLVNAADPGWVRTNMGGAWRRRMPATKLEHAGPACSASSDLRHADVNAHSHFTIANAHSHFAIANEHSHSAAGVSKNETMCSCVFRDPSVRRDSPIESRLSSGARAWPLRLAPQFFPAQTFQP